MTQSYSEHLLEAGQKPKEVASGWCKWRWILLPALGLLALALLALALLVLALQDKEVGSPRALNYLYISFHGDGSATSPLPEYGVNQILSFDLENLQQSAVSVLDLDVAGSPTPPRMLRDMKVLKDGTLFVAQGLKFDSCILQYGPCDQHGVRRHCWHCFQKSNVSSQSVSGGSVP